MTDVQQTVAESGIVGRALNLLSDHVLTILALMLVGMLVGMATTAVVRMFLSSVEGDGPKAWDARTMLLTRVGAASSGLWTGFIVGGYLIAGTPLNVLMSLVVAVGAGLLAAAGNRPLFKPVKASWKWALGKLRKRIEQDHGAGSASDLDETDFRRKP